MHWGRKIIVAFIGFIALLFTLVYVSVNTEFNLVEENYYEQELAYEAQIQRIKNHENLEFKPTFRIDRKAFLAEFSFPEELVDDIAEGKISFYRSSTARYDRDYKLSIDEHGKCTVDISKFPIGAWKVKLSWTDGEKEYYKEIAFVI